MNNKIKLKFIYNFYLYKNNYLILQLNKIKILSLYLQYIHTLKKKIPFISIKNKVYYYYFKSNNFLNLIKFLNLNNKIIKIIGFIFNNHYLNLNNIYDNIYNININIYFYFVNIIFYFINSLLNCFGKLLNLLKIYIKKSLNL